MESPADTGNVKVGFISDNTSLVCVDSKGGLVVGDPGCYYGACVVDIWDLLQRYCAVSGCHLYVLCGHLELYEYVFQLPINHNS